MASVIIGIIVAAGIGLDVIYLIRSRKKGKGTCSCSAGNTGGCNGQCSGCDRCH